MLLVVEEILVWLVEELDRGIVAGSLRSLESSGKTSDIVSHSCSILLMSFGR